MSAVAMPAGFREAFALACERYGCHDEEREAMKQCVREHPEEAATCFFALQWELLGPAAGANERIRASIAEKAAK